MKTVFILTYYIMLSNNINKLEIEKKQESCASFQAALDVYNEAARFNYIITLDIKQDSIQDIAKVDTNLIIDINYADSIHNINQE